MVYMLTFLLLLIEHMTMNCQAFFPFFLHDRALYFPEWRHSGRRKTAKENPGLQHGGSSGASISLNAGTAEFPVEIFPAQERGKAARLPGPRERLSRATERKILIFLFGELEKKGSRIIFSDLILQTTQILKHKTKVKDDYGSRLIA